MALGLNYRAGNWSTSGASAYSTTTTYTPAANSLLACFVMGSVSSGPVDPNHATAPFDGHGIPYASWTKLTLSANTVGTTHACSVWVADSGASPTSAACTARWSSNRTGCVLIEFEITGADLAGGAAAAIVQNPTTNGTGSNITATNLLAAAGDSTNRALAFWAHLANEQATAGGGNWSEPAGADGSYNTPATGAEAQITASTFDRSPAASWSSNVAYRVIALEIKNLSAQALSATTSKIAAFALAASLLAGGTTLSAGTPPAVGLSPPTVTSSYTVAFEPAGTAVPLTLGIGTPTLVRNVSVAVARSVCALSAVSPSLTLQGRTLAVSGVPGMAGSLPSPSRAAVISLAAGTPAVALGAPDVSGGVESMPLDAETAILTGIAIGATIVPGGTSVAPPGPATVSASAELDGDLYGTATSLEPAGTPVALTFSVTPPTIGAVTTQLAATPAVVAVKLPNVTLSTTGLVAGAVPLTVAVQAPGATIRYPQSASATTAAVSVSAPAAEAWGTAATLEPAGTAVALTLNPPVVTLESTSGPINLSAGPAVVGIGIPAADRQTSGNWSVNATTPKATASVPAATIAGTNASCIRITYLVFEVPDVGGQAPGASATNLAVSAPVAVAVPANRALDATVASCAVAFAAPSLGLATALSVATVAQAANVPDASIAGGNVNIAAGTPHAAASAPFAYLPNMALTFAVGEAVGAISAPVAVLVPQNMTLAAGTAVVCLTIPGASNVPPNRSLPAGVATVAIIARSIHIGSGLPTNIIVATVVSNMPARTVVSRMPTRSVEFAG